MTKHSKKLVVALCLLSLTLLPAMAQTARRYSVAACDWMMLKRQKLGEFALSKDIGAHGVEMDMGPLGQRVLFDNKMRDPMEAAKFKHTADSLGIEVPSIAMSGFFAQNFIRRGNYRELLEDCINTMHLFGSKVAFLPLGGCGDGWKKPGAEREELVKRLRVAGQMAVANGVVFAIRTALPAKESKRLIREVGSKGIKIYYNFQDATDNGWDIPKELKILGRKNIAQIHASNTDGVNLRDDRKINLPAIKRVLDKMGWSGWLVVERSRDAKRVKDVRYNFGNNVTYLKEVFKD